LDDSIPGQAGQWNLGGAIPLKTGGARGCKGFLERLKSPCAASPIALMLCLSIIMNVVIITGAAGLISSESVKRFARMYESKLAHR
jgi:hypothetical protein